MIKIATRKTSKNFQLRDLKEPEDICPEPP